MNIQALKEALNNNLTSDEQKEYIIIHILAKDKSAMPMILEVLKTEREINRELMIDMNLELSRAHIFIEEYTPEIVKLKNGKHPQRLTKYFILDEISAFYVKYKGMVQHCFNRFN